MRTVKPRPMKADLDAIIAASWPECVSTLLGPDYGSAEVREQQRLNALRLAVAALDFSGETNLAADVRERLADITS